MKTYYKATDKNMQCRGYKFKLGEWSDPVDGELVLCENGYHFCEHMSGVWAYYNDPDTRVFQCEVRDAIISTDPGADAKSVCRQIKLVEEVSISGNQNTGNRNTGTRNAGHENTGHLNTGDQNTGNRNTGDRNTGNRNTGNQNTGTRNAGYENTGDRNTGNRNAGNQNTGHQNTGNRNAGHENTGHWNIGSHHTGCFGVGDAPFLSFGKPADRASFPWDKACSLYDKIAAGKPVSQEDYKGIPNATAKSVAEYIEAFNKAKGEK